MPMMLPDRTKFVLSISFWERRLPDPGSILLVQLRKRAPLKRRGGFGRGLKSWLLTKYGGNY